MIKNKILKSTALLFSLTSFSFAEDLSQLLELSVNNKLLDASKIALESKKLAYDSLKSSYLPSVTVGGKTQMTSKETNSTPENLSTIYGTISYTIYDGGKRENSYESHENSINSANSNVEYLKNQIALQIINNYYTYLSLLSQKEAKLQEIEQLKAQQIRLEAFLDVGSTTTDEVQKIVSRVESSNVELSEIDLNIETILHNLEYIIGKPVSISKGSKIEENLEKGDALKADIKALEYDTQALLSNAKAKKGDNLPMLSLNNTVTKYDLNYDSKNFNSDDYEQNVVSLNLSWKIFDFEATNKSYESAYKNYLASKSQLEYEKNKNDVDLNLAIRAYKISKQKISSANLSLNAANSTYEAVKTKYQNGLVDNISYLEALSEKFNAQSLLASATYDLEIKKANIIYLSGKNLEEYVK